MSTPRLLNRTPGYEEHIFDFTTKYLARDSGTWATPASSLPKHDYFATGAPGNSGQICESWRFPIVEPHFDPNLTAAEYSAWNEVTFIYQADRNATTLPSITVIGLPFAALQDLQLEPVGDSSYLAATVLLPAGTAFRYALIVNGQLQLDPLNPQRVRLGNGEELSSFFTFACFEPVTFEPWERMLLRRITSHILPFNSREAELFQLRPGGGPFSTLSPQLYRLDHGVGSVNYIDKLLAREERHHLPAYKSCLAQMNRILRTRNPFLEPRDMPESDYTRLYDEMASGNVPGWDYTAYSSPSYFLFLLRRHTFVGAFCHPKYGGNANGSGWLWLEDLFRSSGGQTLFDWERGVEPPIGKNPEYRG